MGKKFVICSVVFTLGFLALLFGITAEVKQVKAHDAILSGLGVFTCSYPRQAATVALGIIAALCILVAQIVANAFGGCVCFCAKTKKLRPRARKTAAAFCLLLSWIVSLVSIFLLMIFGLANGLTSNNSIISQSDCPVPIPGGLIIGGCLAMVGAILDIIFYLLATSKPNQAEVYAEDEMPVISPSATPSHHRGGVKGGGMPVISPSATPSHHRGGVKGGGMPVTKPAATAIPPRIPPPHRSGGAVQAAEVWIPVTPPRDDSTPTHDYSIEAVQEETASPAESYVPRASKTDANPSLIQLFSKKSNAGWKL